MQKIYRIFDFFKKKKTKKEINEQEVIYQDDILTPEEAYLTDRILAAEYKKYVNNIPISSSDKKILLEDSEKKTKKSELSTLCLS